MGKKQHQKDKLYLTSKEWKEDRGGCKKKETPKFFRLPFEMCCLSFHPYTNPYCNASGHIFDITAVVPFIEKFGKDPISGETTTVKDLIKLNFHKNSANRYHCPITNKEFTENVHVVAVKTSGNVYAFEAVEELNYKLNNFKDLINETPFTKKDVVTLQNPKEADRFNCATYYHIVHNLKTEEEDYNANNIRFVTPEAASALSELERTFKPKSLVPIVIQEKKLTARNAAYYSTGAVAYGLTCTAFAPTTVQTPAILDDDVVRYPRIKKKGYVQLVTNMGNLNLQLHCDLTPKTCENFLRLCRSEYYNDTVFFRIVREYMIQGGDPDATGYGGQSAFGKPFKDELRANLRHDQRGVLSMANTNRNTNTSQFFITFNACNDFDNRYTVFGKVVGGFETLTKLEDVPTDDDYHPLVNVRIVRCNIFADPFEELDKEMIESKAIEPETEYRDLAEEKRLKESTEVGKYLKRKNKVGKKEHKITS